MAETGEAAPKRVYSGCRSIGVRPGGPPGTSKVLGAAFDAVSMTSAVLGFRPLAQEWAGGRNRERVFRRSAPDEGFGPDAVETGGEPRFRCGASPRVCSQARSGPGVFGPPVRLWPSDNPERAARLTRGCSRTGRLAVKGVAPPMVAKAEERTPPSVAEK